MISLHQVSVHYGDRYVLDGLSLDLQKGDFVLIYGGAGSGKTTFMHSLLGLQKVYEGDIFIDGRGLKTLTKEERSAFLRSTGILLEERALLGARSVVDNLKMAGARDSQVQIMLQFLHLTAFGNRQVKTLSAGEKKLVDIGRSLITDPKMIVWDSPFQHLDTVSVKRVQNYLFELHKSKKTILLTTSKQWIADECKKLPDIRVYSLQHGKLVKDT